MLELKDTNILDVITRLLVNRVRCTVFLCVRRLAVAIVHSEIQAHNHH